MTRLLTFLLCCFLIFSLAALLEKKSAVVENETNPDEHPVSVLRINSSIPYSTILTNYVNIGISNQAGAINCLVVSRTDSNLVLAGSNNGGVWISHDAAQTWQPVNDTAPSLCVTSIAQNFFRPNEFYYSTGVNIYDNGNLLFDVYHSVDYGQTFSNVHAVSFPHFGSVSKIVASPIDSNTLYVVHNQAGGNGTLYRTIDNCNSFQSVYQSAEKIDDLVLLPNGTVEIGTDHSVFRSYSGNTGTYVQSTGMNNTGYDTRLAVCESQPNVQYCSVYLFGGYDFFKSLDTGATWTYLSTSSYGYRLAVKPDDPDFVFMGAINTRVSLDGGNTWQLSIGGHDLRSYNFDPHRPGKVYITSDFGISTVEVDPITPTSFNDEYPADSLLYSQEAYFGDHGATGYQTLQGYQDLGSRYIQNMTQSKYMMSGDGAWTFISKQNPDIAYMSAQYGDISRADHLTTSLNTTSILNQLDSNNNGTVDEGTMFIHPFVMNNANDSQLYFPTLERLWRSTDRGDNWTPVSAVHTNQWHDVSIVCTSKPNPIVYWTYSDSVFVLANAATALPYSELGIEAPFDIERSFTDPNHDSALYVINESAASRISYCENLFDVNPTWTDIPLSMLQDITVQCMAVYPGNDQIIFVGSKEGGMYVTLDRGLTWSKEIGLPNVQVTEIKIRESDKKVFIFTYGRGTWTADFTLTTADSPAMNGLNVSAFPNPFQDEMTIEFESELNATVEMIDMQGKLCLRKAFMGKKVNLQTEELKAGVYSIEIFQGNKIIYQGKGIRIGSK